MLFNLLICKKKINNKMSKKQKNKKCKEVTTNIVERVKTKIIVI